MAEKEISYDSNKASRMLLLWALPFSSFFILIFYSFWNQSVNFAEELNVLQEKLFLIIFIFIISIILHELLHAIVYLVLDNWQFKNLSFGFSKNTFSPYCHYSNKVKLWKYKLALTLPGVALGIIPIILSFVMGNFYLLIYGIIFTLGAFGDFYVLWKLRGFNSNNYVIDHPNMMGCIIHENKKKH